MHLWWIYPNLKLKAKFMPAPQSKPVKWPHCSFVPSPSHRPVSDRLQYAKTNGEGLVHFIMCDVSVYLADRGVGLPH